MDTIDGQSIITERWLVYWKRAFVKRTINTRWQRSIYLQELKNQSVSGSDYVSMCSGSLHHANKTRGGFVLCSTVKPMMGVLGEKTGWGLAIGTSHLSGYKTFKAGSHRNLTKCSGSVCRPPVPYENTSASYGWTKQWVLQCITITEWFKWPSYDDGNSIDMLFMYRSFVKFCVNGLNS